VVALAYRVPLVAAAYELQARLYNILALSFVDRYLKNDTQGKHDAAIHSTLYVFAQFFGYRELIRGEIQYCASPPELAHDRCFTVNPELGHDLALAAVAGR
jgi:hypothetical protein